jgi:TonB family protein
MHTLTRVLAVSTLSLLLSTAAQAADVARLSKDCPAPNYLNAWVRADVQGSVVISYMADASGTILEPKVLQSSGYRHLDEATLKAVKNCKAVNPAAAQGQAVAGRVRYDWQIN